jgi:hypothetical protein
MAARFADQLPKLAVDSWNVQDHFHQTGDGQRSGIHHRFHARGLHARPGAAPEPHVRIAAAKRFHEFGRVEIAGSFPCGDQQSSGHFPQFINDGVAPSFP